MTKPTPISNYLVCATPRTGSSVICEALAATDVAGRPHEYLHAVIMEQCCAQWGVPSPATLPDSLRVLSAHARTPNGVFGLKVMPTEFARLLRQIPPDGSLTPVQVLGERLLPGLRYVRVVRRDALRQAVSYLRARQTRHWSLQQARTQAPKVPPHYDFAALDKMMRMTDELRAKWDAFFAERPTLPTLVYYEDFVADREAAVRSLLAALDIDAPQPLFRHRMSLERQGDALNEEWVERYRADKISLQGRDGSPSHSVTFENGSR